MFKRIKYGLAIGIVSAVIALILWSAGLTDRMESAAWDWRVRLFSGPGTATDSIRLIFIDQYSLDWARDQYGLSWPWPRQVYERVIDFCRRGGARAIAFDLVFFEPSYIGVDDDEIFGSAIKKTGNFAASIQLSNEQGTAPTWPERFKDKIIVVEGLEGYISRSGHGGLKKARASFPVPEIGDKAAVFGTVSGKTEGAVIRRAIPFLSFDGKFVPSLGLAAFIAAHPDITCKIRDKTLSAGGHVMPLDKNGHTIIRYRGPTQTHKTVNIAGIIQSEERLRQGEKPLLDPSFLKDAYVFVGPTAHAILDRVATPLTEVAPGVEIHATLLDNFLSDDLFRDAPIPMMFLLTILLSLLAGIAGMLSHDWRQAVISAIVFLPMPLVPGFAVYKTGLWLPIAVAEIAVILSLAGAFIVIYAIEGRQKRFIKNAFSIYLAPAVVKQLVDAPDKLKLGGERREITAFFSDLQGFTTISENLEPERLVLLLNDYLTEMTDIVLKHEGTVDKFEGDAIIAFFGAPLDVKNHAEKACLAAVEMQNRMRKLRLEWKAEGKPELKMRIGLYTGYAVVGNMGSKNRMDYTMMGDTVNTASRLEGINKVYGIYTLVGEPTRKAAGDAIVFRRVDSIIVVGKKEPVTIYEPLGFKTDVDENTLKTAGLYEKGLEAYKNRAWDTAIDMFHSALAITAEDGPSKLMIQRCHEYKRHPPEDDWNGACAMKTK